MERGTVIGGFRIERLLGRGSLGAVYEATQLSLGRTVALRLLDDHRFSADPEMAARFPAQQQRSASLHHPNIVPTYEVGEWEGGRFVVTRYVGGGTLADLLERGSMSEQHRQALLGPLGDALRAAHEAGLVHGRVNAANVLVDAAGTPQLADFGLGRSGSVDGDRDDFAALSAAAAESVRRVRSGVVVMTVLAAFAVLAVVVAITSGTDDEPEADGAAPTPLAGTVQLGSELAPGPALSVGCDDQPGPNTPICTFSQSSLAGEATIAEESGVIRSWAVRGASGELTLQVVGRRGGHEFLRGFSQAELIPDPGPQMFDANLPVERGDQIGVALGPGAAVGARTAQAGSAALRWEGTIDYSPEPQESSRIDQEILVRADIEPDARPDLEQLVDGDAEAAPAGKVLAATKIDLASGGVARVVLVLVGDRIALDAFRDRQRLARVTVADAAAGGRLIGLEGQCGFPHGFCLRWLNQGELTAVIHAYRLTGDGSAFRLIS